MLRAVTGFHVRERERETGCTNFTRLGYSTALSLGGKEGERCPKYIHDEKKKINSPHEWRGVPGPRPALCGLSSSF